MINTDGSVRQPNSRATAGGLIRNDLGKCLGAFAANLGTCTITRAELKGVVLGLQLAWKQGHKKVILKTDSQAVFDLLSSADQSCTRYSNLLRQFQEIRKQNWEIHITYCYCECNKVADFLANKGHTLSCGVHVIDIADPGLNFWVLYDSLGIAQDRLI
ncbi:unnamed protein product [Linum tenue]|uniref:RNase H type-1 domain-containing protein n=1 Tax=Linum tenue TaxID=586396 RepID=A0AAV0R8B9_9ROSI|nr:unnamed protein product [Linum tenue]CAI0553426.1 unnamed protein product [Linum tenue]